MVPVNLLNERSRTTSSFKYSKLYGITPDILFLWKFNYFKSVRVTISFGISPTRLLSDKFIDTILSPFNLTPYQSDTGEDKSHCLFQLTPFVAVYNFNSTALSETETSAIIDTENKAVSNKMNRFFIILGLHLLLYKNTQKIDYRQFKSTKYTVLYKIYVFFLQK
jgi:hypothetical protein